MATLNAVLGCCTMKMVVGLGETAVAGLTVREAMAGHDTSVEGLTSQLRGLEEEARADGNGIILCAVNNQQKNAVQALRNRGWAHSRWASKTEHPETKIRLYFKRLNREE